MLIIEILFLILVASLSFYGGVWLWKGISSSHSFSRKNVLPVGIFLNTVCIGVSISLIDNIFFAKHIDINTNYFVLLIALSLCYNGGYLSSIKARERWSLTVIVRAPIFLLAPIFSFLLAIISKHIYQQFDFYLFFIVGLLFFITGFFIWEVIKQAEIFNNDQFMKTLWQLSVGFVVVSCIITVLGVASIFIPVIEVITLHSILAVFVSLSAYCLGLIYPLIFSKG